jgi:putative DNA primase/helicase
MEAIMEAKEVKAAAHGRWGGILSALAPQLQPALDRVGHHVSCPVHGGKDGYRVFNDVDDSEAASAIPVASIPMDLPR